MSAQGARRGTRTDDLCIVSLVRDPIDPHGRDIFVTGGHDFPITKSNSHSLVHTNLHKKFVWSMDKPPPYPSDVYT